MSETPVATGAGPAPPQSAAAAAAAPPSTEDAGEPASIRGYRARKLRPCDNCRVRRKRCLIFQPGRPCSLCVQTRKECTFLRKRPPKQSSAAVEGMTETTRSNQEEQPEAGPSSDPAFRPPDAVDPALISPPVITTGPQQIWSGPAPGFPVSNPLPLIAHNVEPVRPISTAALLGQIRASKPTTSPAVPAPNVSHLALDDEAAFDEELYLVGTASERDALILNTLTMEDSRSTPGSSDIPGLRIRVVSPNVSFVFYKFSPYGTDAGGGNAWRQVEAMVGSMVASETVEKFFEIEGQGLPIFNPISHFHLPDILRCLCLSAGLIYVPSHRHLHRSVYMTTMAAMRRETTRARLWTMQAYLLDLNGREAINPSGNFVLLGLAGSVARLLGLHEDCGGWMIPEWEKVVRTRLWWALVSYDRLSSLTFGRPRTIHDGTHVPLPERGRNPSPSLDAFISLCELTNVLDFLPASSFSTNTQTSTVSTQDQITIAAFKLDEWKLSIDTRGLLSHTFAPGVQSLCLTYLGVRLVIVRALWDALATGTDAEAVAQQAACQRGCLQTCQEIVDFVCGLSAANLAGYWSSHCPFILSFCLTLLVRLIMASDRSDQSSDAIWQAALFALRRLITVLAGYLDTAQWDIAKLVISRARYFIPLLARHAAELHIALWPLQEELGGPPPPEQSIDDFINSIFNPMGQ